MRGRACSGEGVVGRRGENFMGQRNGSEKCFDSQFSGELCTLYVKVNF